MSDESTARPTAASLVTVAHGTRHAPGNLVAAEITEAAAARLGVHAEATYVELCAPLFADLMRGRSEATVVVPLLLSTGFHMRTDLPDAVATATGPVSLGRPLGPDPLVAQTQCERLTEAGVEPGQPLVMVAAGSRDPDAMADLEEAARLLGESWGVEVRVATLGGLGSRPADVIRAGDVVSPYLLSPGFFADRARDESTAAGAVMVAGVMGPHRLIVELVCQRYRRG